MNANFRKLYEQSNYSAIGFSQIIGVSRQRFYRIINNKQVLRENTYYKYKIKFLKHQKRITLKFQRKPTHFSSWMHLVKIRVEGINLER